MYGFPSYPRGNADVTNLDWVINAVKEVSSKIAELSDWIETHQKQFDEFQKLYDQVITGKFPASITEAFYNWMRENAVELVGSLVKNVFFEITDSGYFVVNIPTSWKDIIFNTTGLDIEEELQPEYGHLVLSY